MICTPLTARRLKAGAYDDFRALWGAGEEEHPEIASKWNPVYLTRDVNDENVVVAFGLFNGSLDELRQAQKEYGYRDAVDRMAPYVEEVLLDGAYEVIEEQQR
jgi:hypothetical protein